jgi:hypothetical protein
MVNDEFHAAVNLFRAIRRARNENQIPGDLNQALA